MGYEVWVPVLLTFWTEEYNKTHFSYQEQTMPIKFSMNLAFFNDFHTFTQAIIIMLNEKGEEICNSTLDRVE